MKVLILAGGLGSRLSEETGLKPKPMVEIGNKPILWHIMKIYSFYGFNEFVLLLGYKGYVIKEYFANYFLHQSDVTFDMKRNKMEVHNNHAEPWKVTLIDTGVSSMTGGRIKRASHYINGESFLLTYGDGVSDVNISEVVSYHEKQTGIITMTSVQPEGRFGSLKVETDGCVRSFKEKPAGDGAWINGGFFVCEPEVLDYIDNDLTVFEEEPLEKMAEDGKLFTYRHKGFWKPMDTIRDKVQLESLVEKNQAPWMHWK